MGPASPKIESASPNLKKGPLVRIENTACYPNKNKVRQS